MNNNCEPKYSHFDENNDFPRQQQLRGQIPLDTSATNSGLRQWNELELHLQRIQGFNTFRCTIAIETTRPEHLTTHNFLQLYNL